MTKARCSPVSITIISLIWANMITHNGKQVTLAMRNRKAINLIARNGKAMFGELEDLRMYGITYAAKAVILAEYGKQVWSDVRDYAKAHPAIVPFINQDPHLACSISTNSNKERWLVGDGKAYINTGVKSSATTIFEMQVQYLEVVSASQFNGVFASDHRLQIGSTTTGFGIGYGSLHITVGENKPNITHTAKIDGKQKKGYDNGKEYSFASATFNANKKFDIYLFARWRGDQNLVDAICKEMVAYAAIDDHTFIPHLTADGQCGMLDLVTYTFHPNANTEGQFTIAITDKE